MSNIYQRDILSREDALVDSSPILRIENLSFSHGTTKIVEDLNLQFYPGRHYVLAGPNGAGKSTVLDLISRLKTPQGGRIKVYDRDTLEYEPLELAKLLSLAPQSFQFNFSFTVKEIVSLGRRPYLGRWGRLTPEDEKEVERAIDFLNLTRLSNKLVTALSGGEAQRVVLARTLAQATPIILLDEPTASLDVAQALDLMVRVQALTQGGALIITVTHDLHLAAVYADEMIFLKHGKLIAAGPRDLTLTPTLLKEVFEAEAQVLQDDFTGGLSLSFREIRCFHPEDVQKGPEKELKKVP
ncbi:MAG: ABC transporter ATP-binding protein [Deltaproteobacteria bacterium]|jgi:iron complex transport system ATP-binding protein|nr:ABC transporter ATP-binding protein [Deltaproteobacteria bacterium]